MKVAVIGAGVSGLVAIKYSKALGIDVICFEQTNHIGGHWAYSDATGIDQNGLKVHSAMYKNLRTDLCNQLMSFLDFEFKSSHTCYRTWSDMLEFLKDYAKTFDLEKYVNFEHHVESVEPLEDEKWVIQTKNLKTNEIRKDTFDAVFVCNGQYVESFIPVIPGLKHFQGHFVHSHDYRKPDPYKNKNVLIVGSGPSGLGLTLDLTKFAAKIFLSHHNKELFKDFASNVSQKPDVLEVLSNGMIKFKDGTSESVDEIIFCTGYSFNFPFLTPECEIKVEDNHITELYKHIVNINHPTMFFIGIPYFTIFTYLVEYQVQYCLEFLRHPEKRPTKEEMRQDNEKDIRNVLSQGFRKKELHRVGVQEQFPYMKHLAEFAGVEPLKPVYEKLCIKIFDRVMFDPVNLRRYKQKIISDEDYVEELVE